MIVLHYFIVSEIIIVDICVVQSIISFDLVSIVTSDVPSESMIMFRCEIDWEVISHISPSHFLQADTYIHSHIVASNIDTYVLYIIGVKTITSMTLNCTSVYNVDILILTSCVGGRHNMPPPLQVDL